MVGMIKLRVLCAALATAVASRAQAPADALSGFQQNAEKRTAEWTTLAVNLEQRVTRLLPCDPRVRGAIEETSRASEARIAALTTYWMGAAGKSRSQLESIRRLAAQEEARKEEWTGERAHAEEERKAVTEQTGFLAVSASRLPALADAQKSLTATSEILRQIETRIQTRESVGNELLGEMRDLLKTSQIRQDNIEAHLKFISTEGARWNAYYDARLKRAQTECVITDSHGEAPPAPAASPRGKKQ